MNMMKLLYCALALHLPQVASAQAAISPLAGQDNSAHIPDVAVECGKTYHEGVISLTEDLICNGNIPEADGSRNAAIILNGPVTLDCNGHEISQATPSIDSAVDCVYNNNWRDTKQTCGLFYITGVFMSGGATVKNCNVQQFYVGADIYGQGIIEDSDINNNARGIQVDGGIYSPTYGLVNVVRSTFHDNGNEDLNEREILIKDITSKNNDMQRNLRKTEAFGYGIIEKSSGSVFLTIVGFVVFGISLASSVALPFFFYYKIGR